MRRAVFAISAVALALVWLGAPFFAGRAAQDGALWPLDHWEALRSLLLVGRAGQIIASIAVATLGALLLLEASDQSTRVRRRRMVLGGVLLAILYLFPVFARLGFWALDESDWAEASTTVAAMRQTIAVGQLPQWNPFVCGGSPGLANPQTYLLPLALPLSFLVGDVVAIKAEMVVVITLGVIGMFWLSRILGLTSAPTLLASSVFMFSGFATAHLANGQVLWLTLAFVPWAVGAFLKSRARLWWAVPAAVAVTLIFVEGRVYLVAYLAVFLALLAAALALRDRTIRPLVSLVAVAILTLAFSAWKLLPTLDFLAQTQASLPNNNGLPPQALADAFLGRTITSNVAVSYGADSFARHEIAAYVGILPLLLALASLRRLTLRRAFPFLATGGVFLLLAMQQGATGLLEYLPLARELRNPSRMTSMVVFSVALLSGLGLAGIREQLRRSRFARGTSAVAPVVAVIVLVDLLLLGWTNLSPTFRFSPQVVADLPPGFFQTRLPERQPANGYPTVAAGYGAKDFCPAVLQAFRPQWTVRAREDGNYRGELFGTRNAELSDVTITPNVITARVHTDHHETILVNQVFARGWTAAPYAVRQAGGLIGVDLPPGDHRVTLRYRTPLMGIGTFVTLASVALLAFLRILQRRRPLVRPPARVRTLPG